MPRKLVLARSSPYTPDANFCKEIPFDSFLVRKFSYISLADSVECGVFLTHLMLCLFVRIFSYTPDATFSEEFLLHTSCYIYS